MMQLAELANFHHVYLVGIKGVGMTALAQCLADYGLKVSGTDVEEEFITQRIIQARDFRLDVGFDHQLPKDVDLLVYTAAHQSANNPLVVQAKQKKIPILSLAEATALFFNQKQGIAVAGVGGKSTTSAMLAFVMEKLNADPSYIVGVGEIKGLKTTGRYQAKGKFFVAEADEYASNPDAVKSGASLIARFSYLNPEIIVCTNLRFDHPDVYQSFEQTQETFLDFFKQLKQGGKLVVNLDQLELMELAKKLVAARPDIKIVSFGNADPADYQLGRVTLARGHNQAEIFIHRQPHQLVLDIPGKFNFNNALATIAVLDQLGFKLNQVLASLQQFRSTGRRLEFLGEKDGILHYDDYAHHPSEIELSFQALADWYQPNSLWVAFQPHTYSRTKSLWEDFVRALSNIPNLILVDIFSSARETKDSSVSCQKLADTLNKNRTQPVPVVTDYQQLQALYPKLVMPGQVFMTMGAGDLYLAHPKPNQYD